MTFNDDFNDFYQTEMNVSIVQDCPVLTNFNDCYASVRNVNHVLNNSIVPCKLVNTSHDENCECTVSPLEDNQDKNVVNCDIPSQISVHVSQTGASTIISDCDLPSNGNMEVETCVWIWMEHTLPSTHAQATPLPWL